MIRLETEFEGKRNFTRVTVNGLTLYFSYKTIVAFEDNDGFVSSKNVWSNTTGKHLNLIPGNDPSQRVEYDEFEKELRKALKICQSH